MFGNHQFRCYICHSESQITHITCKTSGFEYTLQFQTARQCHTKCSVPSYIGRDAQNMSDNQELAQYISVAVYPAKYYKVHEKLRTRDFKPG